MNWRARVTCCSRASVTALIRRVLIGAGLMLRTFLNLLRTDPGFEPEHVITAAVWIADLPWIGYHENAGAFTVEGQQPPPHGQFRASYHVADAGYFSALGIPLLRGRLFDAPDDAKSRRMLIVNRAITRASCGSAEAIGDRMPSRSTQENNSSSGRRGGRYPADERRRVAISRPDSGSGAPTGS